MMVWAAGWQMSSGGGSWLADAGSTACTHSLPSMPSSITRAAAKKPQLAACPHLHLPPALLFLQAQLPPGINITHFLPVTSAIQSFASSLDPDTRSQLLGSLEAIMALLSYHAVWPPLRVEDMVDGMVLTTAALDPQASSVVRQVGSSLIR